MRFVVSTLISFSTAICGLAWTPMLMLPSPPEINRAEPNCVASREPPRTAARSSWLSSVVTARSLMFISILRKSQSWLRVGGTVVELLLDELYATAVPGPIAALQKQFKCLKIKQNWFQFRIFRESPANRDRWLPTNSAPE